MLIELWMLLVIVYMSSGGELLLNTYILNNWWWCGELFMWTYAFVVESYVHAFMTDGGGFYIQLRWLWCFCCIMGDDLEETWYHMHICVEYRRISSWHESWLLHVNDECDDKCVWRIHTCNDWKCYVNVYMEVKCSWWLIKDWIYVLCRLLFVDYDWCKVNLQWFWPPTCLYGWVDAVHE
jgi:hypothetical protein